MKETICWLLQCRCRVEIVVEGDGIGRLSRVSGSRNYILRAFNEGKVIWRGFLQLQSLSEGGSLPDRINLGTYEPQIRDQNRHLSSPFQIYAL